MQPLSFVARETEGLRRCHRRVQDFGVGTEGCIRGGSGVVQVVPALYRTDAVSISMTGRIPEPWYKSPGENGILYPC